MKIFCEKSNEKCALTAEEKKVGKNNERNTNGINFIFLKWFKYICRLRSLMIK